MNGAELNDDQIVCFRVRVANDQVFFSLYLSDSEAFG